MLKSSFFTIFALLSAGFSGLTFLSVWISTTGRNPFCSIYEDWFAKSAILFATLASALYIF